MLTLNAFRKAIGAATAAYGIAEVLELTSVKAILDTLGRLAMLIQLAQWLWSHAKDHPVGVVLVILGAILFFKDFTPKRAGLEALEYKNLELEFENLPWARKFAVKLLCEGIRDEARLGQQLNLMGFGPNQDVLDNIIASLRTSNLLEYKSDGTLRPNPVRLKDVDEIVAKWDMAITPRV